MLALLMLPPIVLFKRDRISLNIRIIEDMNIKKASILVGLTLLSSHSVEAESAGGETAFHEKQTYRLVKNIFDQAIDKEKDQVEDDNSVKN